MTKLMYTTYDIRYAYTRKALLDFLEEEYDGGFNGLELEKDQPATAEMIKEHGKYNKNGKNPQLRIFRIYKYDSEYKLVTQRWKIAP